MTATAATTARPSRHLPLDGKAALVTGGSRGIGAAIARRLAADGADVALTYVSAEGRAKEVAEDIRATGRRALTLRADSASATEPAEAVHRAAREFGRLDILVNNAGVFPHGPLADLAVEEIDRTLAVHVRAVLLAAQAAAGHMSAGGRVVTIGSNLAERPGRPGVTLYSASKSALLGLTKGLARDLGDLGITANLVQPGPTDTEMNPADGAHADAHRAASALGRFNAPEDIAAMVAHLAGPDAGGITGAAFTLDAGTNV
ncbi:SDR family oxidoreductase [Streptomyces albus subsp. chlorinus]|uniref:SDR family NAD(P)-dependent oxidoreductase n=1 Tax=Streptomyces albus TaxID=1888 RepID=UPI0015704E52|nr:SDR family oxidoreductase [Streptomyces albus]NSC21996.1 SDR family oxidoreductase [Streptomyces albus subsp. chlorinus]